MLKSDVTEFHYITPLDNLASIKSHGLLSHARAARLPHKSVAMEEVQSLRAEKRVPGGRRLHEYVNLYFHCRNPMMYYLMNNGQRNLAVIRVSPEVMDTADAVVTDGNAAALTTRFIASPGGINVLSKSSVFAQYWTDTDPFIQKEKKRRRCAELLIPDQVAPDKIIGYYICREQHRGICMSQVPDWPAEVKPNVFFQ